jgi:hypothetical protein
MHHLQFRDAQNKLFRDEEEKRKAEAGRDRPREDSLPHRPAPPVLAGGRQPLIKTIVARVRRFLRGGGGGGVGDPLDGGGDGGGSSRGGGRVAWRGMRELFSQYNIAVTKQGDNTTFSSIWSVDAGAGESLKFLRILALSTQLENVTNHHAAALSGRALIEAVRVLRCSYVYVYVRAGEVQPGLPLRADAFVAGPTRRRKAAAEKRLHPSQERQIVGRCVLPFFACCVGAGY